MWVDVNIVGLFKIRHSLTDSLTNGAGHIGYGINKNYRGKGYASKGLALAIEKAKDIIKGNEIYYYDCGVLQVSMLFKTKKEPKLYYYFFI